MAIIRAQCVFQGGSGLPEDRFVNTFHFASDGQAGVQIAAVHEAMAQFYNDGFAPSTQGIGAHLNNYVKRQWVINCYDLAEPTPRTPVPYFTVLPDAIAGGTSPLPEEVACCLSFKAVPPNAASRRGRVYIGPLVPQALTTTTATTPVRVAGAFRGLLGQVAMRLRDRADVDWCVYSPTYLTTAQVANGWVDDAVDIQRRRGPDFYTRQAWGV